MGAVPACKLCLTEPRLQLAIRFAPIMVFHTVIDHGWPIERIQRVHRMVRPSGEAIWGLGSLGRQRAHYVVWRVRVGWRPFRPGSGAEGSRDTRCCWGPNPHSALARVGRRAVLRRLPSHHPTALCGEELTEQPGNAFRLLNLRRVPCVLQDVEP